MKKQLLLLLCVPYYICAMDTQIGALRNDFVQMALNYCDVPRFAALTVTCKNFFYLGQNIKNNEKEKERIGSLAWYYSLPPHNRFEICSCLLDVYKNEYDSKEIDNDPARKLLLSNEFYAIWNLHEKKRKERQPVLSLESKEGGFFNQWNISRTPITFLRIFVSGRNNPAVKIMLARSKMVQSQLKEDQEYVETWTINSTNDTLLPVLWAVYANKQCVPTIMNFLPQDKDGTIKPRHFLCALSMAISVENKELITFLVDKKNPEEFKTIRTQMFNDSSDHTIPTACQVVQSLFINPEINKDQKEVTKEVFLLAIEKNDPKARKCIEAYESFQKLVIDDEILKSICEKLPFEEMLECLSNLRKKKDLFVLQQEGVMQTIVKTIKSRNFNDQDQKAIFELLDKVSLRAIIIEEDNDYNPIISESREFSGWSDEKEAQDTLLNDDSKYLNGLFDKDINSNKIDSYLKYGAFSLGLVITYFLFLKFHGHLHNSFPSISYS